VPAYQAGMLALPPDYELEFDADVLLLCRGRLGCGRFRCDERDPFGSGVDC
jgi:hypothetical protein